MPKVRTGLTRWLVLAGLLCSSSCQSVPSSFENKTGPNESRPRVFSPRMDYDEWTPLGRGDPLKNDPTFDYVPPVLDRVQYWLDSHTTEASAKRDILVLGVTAKKTSPKIPEQFLKFVDGPKFNRNQEQYRNEPMFHRNDFTGSTGAEPPKVIRTTNFRNGIIDYRNQNRIQNIPTNYYPNSYYNQKPKPYTMMLPPPIIQKPIEIPQSSYNSPQKEKVTFSIDQSQQFGTQTEEGPILQSDLQIYSLPAKGSYSQPHPPTRSSSKSPPPKTLVSQIESIKSVYTPPVQNMKQKFETTTPSVSFEKSNLIYHSTQTLAGGWLASNGPSSSPELNQVTWQTPTNLLRDHYDNGDHNVATSSNHEVVIGQNANIIVDGDSNENEEVVIGQKEQVDLPKSPEDNVQLPMTMITSSDHGTSADVVDQSSGSKMHIVMANTPAAAAVNSTAENQPAKGPIAVVMPANYMDKLNVTMGDRGTMITVDGSKSSFNVTREEIGSNTMMTSEIEQTIQISNPIPPRNVVANLAMSPLLHEDSRQPSRTVPSHVAMHQPPRPSAHPLFGMSNGQQMVQQQMPMPQLHSNHVMMQYMPNMRPNMGPHMAYRPQMSMSHVPPSPPPSMTHMQHGHANVPPPPKSMIGPHISMDQGHQQKPAQPPVMFPGPLAPSPPIMTSQITRRPQAPEDQGHRLSDGQMHMPILPTILPPPSTAETTTLHLEPVTDYATYESPLVKILNNETKKMVLQSTSSLSSWSSVSPTTTVPSLTTDPIFSHYKQPAKPIRGPMYLIIQGHSKVKTYKPSVNKHGVPVENNEIQENTTKYLSKLEQLINENTKSVSRGEKNIVKKETEAKIREKRIGQENLASLVDSGFSAFTIPPPPATEEERQFNSVTTIEINN